MKRLLLASLCLNLALAAAAVHRAGRPSVAAPGQKVSDRSRSVSVQPPAPSNAPAPTITVVTNRFDWGRLESADYEQYAANLRAVGCPESTVRDIIRADVEKHFAFQSASTPLTIGFWSAGLQRTTADRARLAQKRALQEQKRALLERLLGSAGVVESRHGADDFVEQAITRFVVGPVPEEICSKVMAALVRLDAASSELKGQARWLAGSEEETKIHQLNERTLAELRSVMTLAQFEEFSCRAVGIMLTDGDFETLHLSPGDFREIARLHVNVFGALNQIVDLTDTPEEEQGKQARYEKALEDYLGKDRYSEYEREKDPDFRGLTSLAEEQHLSRDIAIATYQIKQLLDDEKKRLRQDTSSPAPERLAQWRAAQAASREAVEQLLGQAAYRAYVGQGRAGWLTNSARL